MKQPPGLGKALSGDRQALGELMGHCHAPVLGYLARLTGSRERAADLAQDAMLRVLESLETWKPRPGASFMSWVFRIARNRFLDDARRGGREMPLPEESSPVFAMPDGTAQRALSNIDGEELRRALERLCPADRELLELRWFHGFSHREIGGITGAAPALVKSRLNAALGRLRRQYGGKEV